MDPPKNKENTENNIEVKAEVQEAERKESEILKTAEAAKTSRMNLHTRPKVRTVDDVIADITGIKIAASMSKMNVASKTSFHPTAKFSKMDILGLKMSNRPQPSKMNSSGAKALPARSVNTAAPSQISSVDTRTPSQQKIDRANKVMSKNLFKRILKKRKEMLINKQMPAPASGITGISELSAGTQANNVLLAFMAFWNPQKRRRDFLVPKDRAAWLEFLVQLVHKKTRITYLSNKELKKVIIRTRPNLAQRKYIQKVDPDCPECFYWDENQVADWVESVGFPNLREAFLLNCINGRRLVAVDVNALRQMGMKYFDEMKTLAGKIREILGLPRPNILRAIMRMVPFEMYLKKRVHNGRTYDLLTFEKFCKDEHFDYESLKNNKNATIPGTTEVYMVPTGIEDDDTDFDKQGSDEEDTSLLNAPTVEFVVRNSILRNKIVTKIIEDILKSALVGPGRKLYGKGIKETMKEALGWGFSELGLNDLKKAKERLDFATSVAKSLLREIQTTSIVLEDLDEVEKHVGEKVEPEKLDYLRECAQQFMEDVVPLAAVVAFGELDLETIFRDTTGMEAYIEEVIDEAQARIDEDQVEAIIFIKEVCDEAIVMANRLKLGYDVPMTTVDLVTEILDEILSNAFIIEMANKRERRLSNEHHHTKQQEALDIVHMVRQGFTDSPLLKFGMMLELMEQLFTTTNIFHEEFHMSEQEAAMQHEKMKQESERRKEETAEQIAARDSLMQEVMQIIKKLREDSNMTVSAKQLVMDTIEKLLSDYNTADAMQSVDATREIMNQIKSKINENAEKRDSDSDEELWDPDKIEEGEAPKRAAIQKMERGVSGGGTQSPIKVVSMYEISVQHTPVQKFQTTQNQDDHTLHQDLHELDNLNQQDLHPDLHEPDKLNQHQQESEQDHHQQDNFEHDHQRKDTHHQDQIGEDNSHQNSHTHDKLEHSEDKQHESHPQRLSLDKSHRNENQQDKSHDNQNLQDQSHPNQHLQDQTHSNQHPQDQTHPNEHPQDQSHPNQHPQDQTHQNRHSQDQSQPNQHSQDQSHPDQHSQDQSHQNRHSQDQSHQNQHSQDESHQNRHSQDESHQNRHSQDESHQNRHSQDESHQNRHSQDESHQNRHSQDQSPPEMNQKEKHRQGSHQTDKPYQDAYGKEKFHQDELRRSSSRQDQSQTDVHAHEGHRDSHHDRDTVQENEHKDSSHREKKHEDPSLKGKSEKENSAKMVEGGTAGTMNGLPEHAQPAQPDQEFKVGVAQVNTKGPKKSKRSELTISDSMTRGRNSMPGSPMDETRKVDSDLAIRKTVFKTHSADSIASSAADGIISKKLTETNLKQSIEEKATTKDKTKMYTSLPGSPKVMTDGEKSALRKVESDSAAKKSLTAPSNEEADNISSVSSGSLTPELPQKSFSLLDIANDLDTEEQKQAKLVLQNKKLHRKLLIESWAQESQQDVNSQNTATEEDPEEHARIIRITADQIVSDIIQLALTHMLLQAESGKDTDNILAALGKIQLPVGTPDHLNTVVLWDPHLPVKTPSGIAVNAANLKTKEGLKAEVRGSIVAAINGGLQQKDQLNSLDLNTTKTERRFNKRRMP